MKLAVNRAISQMDAVTQQNAAFVEQAAAAAASMQEQAGNLAQVVRVFKLADSDIGIMQFNASRTSSTALGRNVAAIAAMS